MPLAKTADTASVQTIPSVNPPDNMSRLDIGGVPVSVYEFFDAPLTIPEKEAGKLKEIYEWAKTNCDEPTMGNILSKMGSLESRLGSPSMNEQRWDKMWRFIKIQRQIDDLKKRQETLGKRWSL